MTKGILAGLGTNKVTGTVKGVSITNSVSDYEDWNTAVTFGEEEFIFKVTNIGDSLPAAPEREDYEFKGWALAFPL